jgi:hypothetical protein
VSEDRGDIETVPLEGVEAQTPEGVVAQDDGTGAQG